MKSIVHISADFPDPLVPAKTRAVASLIDAVGDYRHLVYSLNRVSWQRDVATLPFGPDRIAIAYGAPPYGLALARALRPVADVILADLAARDRVPDLIHAHKFSVEGFVAAAVAERLGRPFVASLWGDTDIKIVAAKRGLRPAYQAIARQAARLLPAAPWTQDYFADVLELPSEKFGLLPVMTAADAVLPPTETNAPHLITVFAFDSWRRKGFDTLVQAINKVARHVPDVRLDVYGRGNPQSLLAVNRLIRGAGHDGRIRLCGPLDHASVQQTINRYAAFVMPTRRETYGMVHVEALLAGVPILWSRGRGIDGYLDGLDVGYRCDPESVDDVAGGVRHLLNNSAHLKGSIRRLQAAGALETLRRPAIAARYRTLLDELTGGSNSQSASLALAGAR
jgi:glycosyltransferase involved in cell wall biosynthesis